MKTFRDFKIVSTCFRRSFDMASESPSTIALESAVSLSCGMLLQTILAKEIAALTFLSLTRSFKKSKLILSMTYLRGLLPQIGQFIGCLDIQYHLCLSSMPEDASSTPQYLQLTPNSIRAWPTNRKLEQVCLEPFNAEQNNQTYEKPP